MNGLQFLICSCSLITHLEHKKMPKQQSYFVHTNLTGDLCKLHFNSGKSGTWYLLVEGFLGVSSKFSSWVCNFYSANSSNIW